MTERYVMRMPTFALSVLVLLSFLLHLFIYSSMASIYAVLVLGLAVAFACSKDIYVFRGRQSILLILWLCALAIVIINYLWIYKNDAVVMDIIVLTSGFMLVLCFSSDNKDYNNAIMLIRFAALFFAFSVFLQLLVPSVYLTVVRMLPSSLAQVIRSKSEGGAIRGFTINSGFTANYILAGIFAAVSGRISGLLEKKKLVACIAILAAAFLVIEKRGPLLFAVMAALICYLIGADISRKLKIVIAIIIGGLMIVVLFVSFQDVIVLIPGMRRVVSSVNGLAAGEDISNGRLSLYTWAIAQFKENPVLGIGWGKYKTTTAGVATFSKSLDVHNVYLQLLCETGVIGFIFFAGVFFLAYKMTVSAYRRSLAQEDSEMTRRWRGALFFSLIFQTYFLLYCLTGNPLYDQFYQILYAFSCSIMMGYMFVYYVWPAEEWEGI